MGVGLEMTVIAERSKGFTVTLPFNLKLRTFMQDTVTRGKMIKPKPFM